MKKFITLSLLLCTVFLVSCSTDRSVSSDKDINTANPVDSESRDAASVNQPTGYERMAHLNNLDYLKEAMTSFYVDNNRFPSSSQEFLVWGLPLWPMNPMTMQPVRFKPAIDENKLADYNDISYNFKSDQMAQFSTMIYNVNDKQWSPTNWPSEKYIDMVISNDNPRKLFNTRSEAARFVSGYITMANGVLFHSKFNRMPTTLKEMTDYAFKVILDNWHPATNSRTETTPGFFEIGIDRDRHYIYNIWTSVEDETRKVAYPYPDGQAGNLMAFASKTLSDKEVDDLNKEVLIASWMTADDISKAGGGITITEIMGN